MTGSHEDATTSDPPGTHGAASALIDHDRYCRNCGLNLRGCPSDGSCPQCGARILLDSAATQVHGVVEWDLACARCSYALRGLDRSAVCPECALPVRQSLYSRGLAAASPVVLRRVGGCLLVEAWCAAGAIGVFILSVGASVLPMSNSARFPMALIVATLAVPAYLLVSCVVWSLLARSIGRSRPQAAGGTRALGVTRVGALLGLCGMLGYVLAAILEGVLVVGGAAPLVAVIFGMLLFGLLLLIFVGVCLKHFGGVMVLRWIGVTHDAPLIVKSSSFVIVLSIVLCISVIVLVFALPLILGLSMGLSGSGSGSGSPQWGMVGYLWAMGIAAGLCGLGLLVLVVAYVGLLLRCRRELTRLRRRIEQDMAAAQAGSP